jgi:hypothetical protein
MALMPKILARRALGWLAGGMLAGAGAGARRASATPGPLPEPTGAVILTISGRITHANRDNTAQFDRAGLEALGTDSFTTATPWFDGPQTFEGVPMARIMRAVGAQGTVVTAIALNDYSTEIPMSDFTRYNVLLALKRNGEYMRVRDKGPLFVVYPYDSAPELRGQPFYGRSAWQLSQIVVR